MSTVTVFTDSEATSASLEKYLVEHGITVVPADVIPDMTDADMREMLSESDAVVFIMEHVADHDNPQETKDLIRRTHIIAPDMLTVWVSGRFPQDENFARLDAAADSYYPLDARAFPSLVKDLQDAPAFEPTYRGAALRGPEEGWDNEFPHPLSPESE